MNKLKSLFYWVKAIGIRRAIDAMDGLEEPLAKTIEEQKKKILELDSHALAKYMVDEIQYELKKKFNLLNVNESEVYHD